MTGQRASAAGEDTYLSRDGVASPATAREPRGVPGSRTRAATPSRKPDGGRPSASAERGTRVGGRRPRRGRAALLIWGLPIVGAGADELLGSAPGWAFAIAAVVAGAVAAGVCSRAGAWWVLYAPPLVAMAVTIVTGQLAGAGSSGKTPTTSAVHWAVDAFPAMAAAELAVIAVLAARAIRSKRSRRGSRV